MQPRVMRDTLGYPSDIRPITTQSAGQRRCDGISLLSGCYHNGRGNREYPGGMAKCLVFGCAASTGHVHHHCGCAVCRAWHAEQMARQRGRRLSPPPRPAPVAQPSLAGDRPLTAAVEAPTAPAAPKSRPAPVAAPAPAARPPTPRPMAAPSPASTAHRSAPKPPEGRCVVCRRPANGGICAGCWAARNGGLANAK
jgi:hypothetical protein